jgi:hypothetical protein
MQHFIRFTLAAAVIASTVACGAPEDLTVEEAEAIMAESQGLSGYCDAQLVAEYCFGAGQGSQYFGAGQCIGQNEYLPGVCILVDPAFGPCQYEGLFCNTL